jgi:hypothetical protein
MRIKVESIDQQTLFLLQDTAPEGVTVKLGGAALENFGSDQPVTAVITFTAGTASGAIGTWLYDKVKAKSARISINRIKVGMQPGEITRIIQEETAKEQSG